MSLIWAKFHFVLHKRTLRSAKKCSSHDLVNYSFATKEHPFFKKKIQFFSPLMLGPMSVKTSLCCLSRKLHHLKTEAFKSQFCSGWLMKREMKHISNSVLILLHIFQR